MFAEVDGHAVGRAGSGRPGFGEVVGLVGGRLLGFGGLWGGGSFGGGGGGLGGGLFWSGGFGCSGGLRCGSFWL